MKVSVFPVMGRRDGAIRRHLTRPRLQCPSHRAVEVLSRTHIPTAQNDLHMTAERREQCDELDDAVEDARAPCDQAGIDLVTAKPTTPAGIVAAIAYIRIQMRDDGTYMPYRMEFEYSPGSEGDSKQTMGWIDAFLETIASAAAESERRCSHERHRVSLWQAAQRH
jgi:hypothetical protein